MSDEPQSTLGEVLALLRQLHREQIEERAGLEAMGRTHLEIQSLPETTDCPLDELL